MTGREKLYEFIVKDLTSEISAEEKEYLEKKLSNDTRQKNNYLLIQRFWNSFFPNVGENHILERTEKKLDFTYHQGAKADRNFLLNMAVTFLLLVSVGLIGFYTLKFHRNDSVKITEYISSPNEIKEVVLSDGTKVWLNASSALLAAEPFEEDNREVRLTGEAYFEVAHNPEKPFVVTTVGLKTKVLGTHFNIVSYPHEKQQEILLYEGKVELVDNNNVRNNVIIHPGQQAYFNNQQKNFQVRKTELGSPAVWRDGVLRFYDEELNHIAVTLERRFQTRILIKDEQVGKLRYTANFEEESLSKILQLLNEAHEFVYYETENGIIIESL
ncbi:MAG: FecR domain-containing protein [Prolixibacteraceae bacterium]|nr:FecR domain-containing protein [Prolixibacteraceae bacterium]